MTRQSLPLVRLTTVAALALALSAFGLDATPVAGRHAALYAIRGARIVPVAGAPIEKGTVVMRDGVIVDVGASVNAPADAIVIDGAGLTVYPGLIDMANSSAVESSDTGAAAAGGGRGGAPAAGGGGRGGAPATPQQTLEDLERAKRASILRPDFESARNVRVEGAEMQRLASAGITSVLAVPPSGVFRGQSALINVLAPDDDPQYSNIADYRRGLVVVKSPVALHVAFGGGQGGGYPGSLLGYISFIRQSFYDAQWQRDARGYSDRHKDAPRPVFEPVLDAMQPAHLIDGAHELRPEWFDGVETVLITAGASAPENVVQDCIGYLQREYGAVLEEVTIREEHVSFPLPRELRRMKEAVM